MNRKIFYTSAALLFLGFLLINSSNGRAADDQQGNTGAPGDNAPGGQTCQNCHNSTAIQVALELQVTDLDGNTVNSYIPGNTYNVAVAVNTIAGTPVEYGFQLVSERDSDNQSINAFANPSSNAKLATVNSTGRQYVEHNGPSASNTFTAQWTAPQAGTGDVTFYSAGNGVNGNNTSSGDGANKTFLRLTEEAGSAVFENRSRLSLHLAPNPASEWIALDAPVAFQGPVQLRIIDLDGRIVRQRTEQSFGDTLSSSVFVGDLPAGTYVLQVMGERQTATGRFLKL